MTDYEELQYDAALRFLQTALFVDDRVSTDPEEEKPEGGLLAPRTPGLRSNRGDQGADATDSDAGEDERNTRETSREDGEARAESERAEQEAEDAANVVHVKPLADLFADLELTCGVLKPVPGEPAAEVTNRVV